jgi:hypothetical protein
MGVTSARLSGVAFAAVAAPALCVALVVGLVLAGAPDLGAFIIGFVAAPVATLMRSQSRGMTIERSCGLAIVTMVVVVGLLVAAVLGVLIYAGGGIDNRG